METTYRDATARVQKRTDEYLREHVGTNPRRRYINSQVEHQCQPALFRSGNQYAKCCTKCGDLLTDWLPHAELSEEEMEGARTDRKEVCQRWNSRREQAREEFEVRRDQIANHFAQKERQRLRESIPAIDAPAESWRRAFQMCQSEGLWWDVYKAYIDSDAWEKRRQKVFRTLGRECTARYDGCRGRATEVHHKNYKLAGQEPLWHLEPVCKSCHEILHPDLRAEAA